MSLCSFTAGGRALWGAAVPGGVVSLAAEFPAWPTLRAAVAAGGLEAALAAAAGRPPSHAAGSFAWDIPLPDAPRIFCVGVNYPERNGEYRDGQEAPAHPSLFVRFAQSFTGHGQPLIRPPESVQLDYEGEIAVVIGRGGRRIPEAAALSHVAGLTLCNEGTVRDWVRHGKFNVTQGKNWDRSGSMGPWLVPFRDVAQIADIRLETRVNGQLRQSDRTGRMLFPVPALISYVSTFTALSPGDILVTGTPAGAGARSDPPVWLKPGDVVEVGAEGIGTLANTVADE